MLNKLIDLILPPRCGSCQKIVLEKTSLCAQCFPKAHFISAPFCSSCGLPFDYEISKETLCLSCQKTRPLFDRARFALPYDDFSKPMILAFKHGDRTDLAPLFAKWIHLCDPDLFEDVDIIIPVPLHRNRMLKRKYNQSGLIADLLSRRTGKICEYDLLSRVKNTKSQGHLSPAQRHKNLQGAFRCNRALSGENILIVDDVLTTGTTVENCTRLLKKSGADKVYVVTLARVLKTLS